MDRSTHSGTTVGGPVSEHGLSTSSAPCQTESGGTILLQLLEFKTHLLEAVEELHIRRDAETRFEDQISKLVLEKQELEWEKESLQHQAETLSNRHAESLTSVKKQFQAKIRNIEEEKGKYQVSAELKDKEINNLKEELKSLQLLKYNLAKKSGELEQKLALQSRSKDSHLNQLGEVEKRFSALSRKCAMVKQAHEKLEQNVDEAMKMNKKLTSANEKQEATIVSLKEELEEVSRKLIQAKMSSVRHEKTHSPTGREQHIQQLLHKLNVETEMNKKLGEENEAVRTEKQEVMRSLQHTQQLLLNQTQTVSRVEQEMQKQREQYQGLKQEHEVMREKSKAMEDKVAQLMESYAAARTGWDKERVMFLDRIKSEQQDLQAVREAHDELHLKHTELSSQAKEQAQHIYELKMRDSSQSQSVSTQVFPSLLEEIREEEALNEPVSSSELLVFGGLQAYASAKNSDGLEDTGAGTKLVATGATGGQSTPTHQQYQFKQPLNPSDNNLFSLCSLSGTTGRDNSILNSNTSENDPVSDLIHTTFSVSDDRLLISKGSPVTDTSTGHIDGSVDLLSKEKRDEGNGGMSEKEQGWKDDVKQGQNNREEEDINEERQWNREEVRGEDVKEGGSAGEMAQTTDRADRREDSQRSTEDAGDTKQPETETKDRAEGEGTDGGAEDRANEGPDTPETPETQIPVQTTTDRTTEKSDTQRVIDFTDTESPPAACETVSEKDAEMRREVQTLCSSDGHQSVSHGPNSAIQEGQHHQTFAESLTQMPVHQGFENTTDEKPSDKLAATIPTEVSEPLNRSSVTICSSQTKTAPLAAQLNGAVSIQDMETTQPGNPSDTANHMKQTDEMCDTHVSSDCVLVSTMIKPLTSEQESGQLKSLVTDDGDSSAYKKRKSQSNADTCENDKKPQNPVEKSNLKDACLDVTVDLESAVETGSCQEHKKNEDAGDAMTANTSDLKLSVLDTDESSLPSSKTYRSSFDWASAQRKPVSSRVMSDVSVLHQFVQGSPMSEQNTNDPGGQLGHPPSTVPMFLKSKHSKVPLVIARASDLLNASSVSGTAASSRRHQQGERRAVGETCRETEAADTDSRASLSITSFPVSKSSVTVSRLSWQTSPGCSRAPTSAAGPSAESEWEPSCSQEREDQQSSFRAQISKIEQFLNTERLRLPKRRRTDN